MIRLKKFSRFCMSFSNEQLCEERERFCKASLLFFLLLYYFNFVSCFNLHSTVRGVCVHTDSKINSY